MVIRNSRKKKKIFHKTRNLPTTSRKRLFGFLILLLGLILFFCFGNISVGIGNRIIYDSTNLSSIICRNLSLPFFYLFGKAAYAVPPVFVALGIILLMRFHKIPRTRWSVRLLVTIPFLSFLISSIGGILHDNYYAGGELGAFYFKYLEIVFGRILSLLLGTFLILILGCLLWGIPLKLKLKRKVRAKKSVLVDVVRAVGKAVRSLARKSLIGINWIFQSISKGTQQKSKPSRPEKSTSLEDWTPTYPTGRSSTEIKAPWQTPEVDENSKKVTEGMLQPFPVPELDEPLSIHILEESAQEELSLSELEEQLPDFQNKIIDIIERTTKVKLSTSSNPPKIGMTSILFEFGKEEGQAVSISNIEKAQKDIGVEIGRAPVRIIIEKDVLIEIPLKDHERIFVPIMPLLKETMPDEDSSLTFLIGRNQNRSPFELKLSDALHMLVGGATGGGKTVLLHTIIFGLIFRYPPSKVRLALADSKIFEFSRYRGLPHLWQDVVTKKDDFSLLVENLSAELQKRKEALGRDEKTNFPALITVVDEFSGYDSRKLIRLIAEARALNMFFILATQYPVAEVISTSIKANLVTGIAFRTRDSTGSQLIIGSSDATSLLGRGDCIVNSPKGVDRVQAGWVTGPRDPDQGSNLECLQKYLADKETIE